MIMMKIKGGLKGKAASLGPENPKRKNKSPEA
jgi:hypothetical protein